MNVNKEIKDKMSKIKMIIFDVDGTLTDGSIYVDMDGRQYKRFFAQDGEGIRRALKASLEIGIISMAGLAKPIIDSRAKMLGIKWVHAERSDKLIVAQKWAETLNFSRFEIAYLGDDIIDRNVMMWCGLAAGVQDMHESLEDIVDLKLSKKGGQGAARQLIDLILDAQGIKITDDI